MFDREHVPAGTSTLPYLAAVERNRYEPEAEKPNLALLKTAIRHLSVIDPYAGDDPDEDTERLITIALHALEMLVKKLKPLGNNEYKLLVAPPEPEGE